MSVSCLCMANLTCHCDDLPSAEKTGFSVIQNDVEDSVAFSGLKECYNRASRVGVYCMYCYFVLWCVSCYALFPRVATILERRILFEFGGGILIESWRWLAKSFSFNLSSSRMKAVRDVTYSDVEHFDGGDVCIVCDCRCLDYFTVGDATSLASILITMRDIIRITNYRNWLIICLVTCIFACIVFVALHLFLLCSTGLFMM